MAKGKSRKNAGTRDASQSLPSRVRSGSTAFSVTLSEVQDLRQMLEPSHGVARLLSGAVASVGAQLPANPRKALSKVPYQIAFNTPAKTLICVRRKIRKQVLFAKRKTGKGGQKKARYNKWSSYRC